jgi:S1-C subfamily serine protease
MGVCELTSALRRRRRARAAASACLAGAATLAALALLAACTASQAGRTGARTPVQAGYEKTIELVLPSVVEVSAGGSTGSGVVFDRHGDIVTNAHVVGTVKKFTVRVSTMSQPLNARLIGAFTPDDLAVIRVTEGANDLKPARWANSADARVGQLVLAMGAPYGLTDSVTQGIVSATGRTVTGPTIPGKPPTVIINAIQTSAAINPGNSGGALVLLTGKVLGIPTLTAQNPEIGGPAPGIGFVIPGNTAVDISRQLIRTGKVTKSDRASLDIVGETHVNSSRLPDGVTVVRARPGGAAARAGIKQGDVIVGVAGRATPSVAEMENVLIGHRPGERVKVEVLRGGNPRQVTATLGSLRS